MGDSRWQKPTVRESPRAPRRSEPRQPATAFDPHPQRYDVGEELGRGGMGRVVAATDVALERQVAIKYALGADQVDLARFAREVRITAGLDHPAIIPIHDVGRDADGNPYYVMRQVGGQTLTDRVGETISIRERLALVPDLLAAVDAAGFAHSRRVVHRDIKPWNILVGAYGETLLIDWGLARELDDQDTRTTTDPKLTLSGHAYGTPGYMAPEQARGEPADARADVYALGATLFFVLTGDSPFGGGSDTAWIVKAAAGLPPPIEKIGDEVPPELVAIVAKAMAIAPDDRYRDGAEMAADLRSFLGGKLVAAHHYTAGQRLARFVRVHRIAVSVGVVAVVALAVTGTVALRSVLASREEATLQAQRAEAAAQRATREEARAKQALDEILAAEKRRAEAVSLRDAAEQERQKAEAAKEAVEREVVETQQKLETVTAEMYQQLLAKQKRLQTALAEAQAARKQLDDVLAKERAEIDRLKRAQSKLSKALK